MPDAYYSQYCQWDGAIGIDSGSYVATHGETPGTGQLVFRLPPTLMSPISNLVLNDGKNDQIVIRGCKVVDSKFSWNGGGYRWYVRFWDRRWRWAESGAISGHYNELDRNGKLVPWKIASPTELAIFCLEKLGEKNYQIDMPPGIDSTQYANAPDYFTVGINTLPTGTNPEIIWQDSRPSAALLDLCNRFGRTLVYDPIKDRIVIARPGVGSTLPVDSRLSTGQNVNLPATPDAIGIVGSPTMYQARLLLVPVAEEWHGQYVPPNSVSYAPAPVTGIRTAVIQLQNGESFGAPPDASVSIVVGLLGYSYLGNSDASVAANNLASQINADSRAIVTAMVSGNTITLTGKFPGDLGLSVQCNWYTRTLSFPNITPTPDWSTCFPPSYLTVRPTDRLTWSQARQYAARSVFRTYRIADYGLAGPGTPIYIPGYGNLVRRHQIQLQPTAVEQVIPQPIDLRQQNRNDPTQLFGVTWDFYNGYARNRDAAVYGTVARNVNINWWMGGTQLNTLPGERLNIPFQIDPINQLVVFSMPVYKFKNGAPGFDFPDDLVLEVGCQITDEKTNEISRYRRWLPIDKSKPRDNTKPTIVDVDLQGVGQKAKLVTNNSGEQPPLWTEWFTHEDVWSEIIGIYVWSTKLNRHVLVDVKFQDGQEAQLRADYYLMGHILQHIVQGGETASYPGFRPIPMDGAIQELGFEFGPEGPFTTSSYRMENAPYLPPAPLRRKKELLDADPNALINNRAVSAPFGVVPVFRRVLGPIGKFFFG